MKFGPADGREALEFAIEELRADTQYELLRAMKLAGMTQADLARKIGVSQAWVSQMLGDDANLTVESLARVFLALGAQCRFVSGPLDAHFAQAVDGGPKEQQRVWHQSRSVDPVDRRVARDTTEKLMEVIQAGCRGRPVMVFTNDNGSLFEESKAIAV